ncbi:MAG: acyl carrier protein [Rhodospirillales bacterium]|jgi:acyl carrier protein
MTEAEIHATLTRIFREVFDDPTLVPTRAMAAADVPEWDSFNHVNLIVAAEMAFGVRFRPGEIDGMKNVGDFADLIARKTA